MRLPSIVNDICIVCSSCPHFIYMRLYVPCRYQKRVSNIIDDVLEWSPKLALSGMRDTRQTDVNQTESDQPSEGSSKASTMGEAAGDQDLESNSGGATEDLGGTEREYDGGQ